MPRDRITDIAEHRRARQAAGEPADHAALIELAMKELADGRRDYTDVLRTHEEARALSQSIAFLNAHFYRVWNGTRQMGLLSAVLAAAFAWAWAWLAIRPVGQVQEHIPLPGGEVLTAVYTAPQAPLLAQLVLAGACALFIWLAMQARALDRLGARAERSLGQQIETIVAHRVREKLPPEAGDNG